MGSEQDSILSLLRPPGALTGREVLEAVSDAVARVAGYPNIQLNVADIAAYANGATGVQAVAGTSYTAQKTDTKQYTRFTNAGAVTFTIPPVGDGSGGTVAWVLGDQLDFEQAGAGLVTPTAGAGVTINCRSAATHTAGQYAVGALKYVAVNTWVLTGDVA